MPDPQDLTTEEFVVAQLAAGGVTLTDAQTAALPALITSASLEIARLCRRWLTVSTYDEILTPFSGQPDRGSSDWIDLRFRPVVPNSITRLCGGRSTALSVSNASTANQKATVEFLWEGDPEINLARVGVRLRRTASGVASQDDIAFEDVPTVADLAAAINALANGWTATATEPYALWPSVDLYGIDAPSGATGTPGVALNLFSTDIAGASPNYRLGQVFLPSYRGAFNNAAGFWPWGDAMDAEPGSSPWRGEVRVTYQAGYDPIPMNLQEACAEAVKAAFYRLKTDDALKSENAKDYSYVLRDVIPALPPAVLSTIALYRSLT